VTYKTGFGLNVCIYCTLYFHTVRNYRQYSAIAILHTFQFNVAHALLFQSSLVLSWQRIYHSLTVTSNLLGTVLIPFLPFLQLPIPKTRLSTLDYSYILLESVLLGYCGILPATLLLLLLSCRTLLINTLYGPHGKHRLLLSRMREYCSIT
jgi:hypothetical protein